ncbi:PH domain-containing protein [Microbacterium insulae]|uniref:PH domain-containing protein n=1 Tax=Microbacterium insulae TaxID=483014 RepID=A0ABW3AHC3_9MICO
MRGETETLRLPFTSIAASWLHHAPSIIELATAAAIYVTQPDLWPGQWAWVGIVGLMAVRMLHPVASWATVRIEATPELVAVRTGVYSRHVRATPWAMISAVDWEEPFAYRLFGLGALSLHPGGDDGSSLRIAGIRRSTAARLAERLRERGGRESSSRSAPAAVVYRATARETLIAGAAYGRFALLGAGVVAAASDLLDATPLLDSVVLVVRETPTLGISVVVAVVIVTGLAVALVRHHGFLVRRTEGRLVISYGLLSSYERTLDPEAVVGVRIERNVVEILFDRVRVSLHSRDTTRRVASNVILPSLPRSIAAGIMAEHLPDFAAQSSILSTSDRVSIARILAAVAAFGCAGVAGVYVMIMLGVGPGIALLLGASGLLAVLSLLGLGCARLRANAGHLVRRSAFLADREDILPRSAVQVATRVGLTSRGAFLVRAHYFAGIPRALTAFTREPILRAGAHVLLQHPSMPAPGRAPVPEGSPR